MITKNLGLWCWLNDQRFEIVATDSGQCVVYVAPGQWDSLSAWEQGEIIKKDLELAKDFAIDNTTAVYSRRGVIVGK